MGFRENLREALEYSGLEQKELAYKANVRLRSIENYLRENGSVPIADKAVQIAQVLGVTVEYLVTGKNSRKEDYSFIDPEIRNLVRVIKKLPKNKQPIVIKSALHLAEML
ncbi:MAG: helix-turn-helix domain-containing protein [Treponema sp.]|jgi:transcriptional regulator with XRE-family HTH domain|nr:helix-turn-helix domain-containing protein [Treponema sp.]